MVQSKKLSSATVAVQAELSTDVSELVSRLQARSLNPACDTVLVIRICLRNKLRTMLLTDIQLAATKNVDRVMWNYCFYDQIQFFRNQIRCLSKTGESYGKSDNLEPKIVGGENSSPQYQVQVVYRNFLSASTGFLNDLLESLALRYNLHTAAELGALCSISRLPSSSWKNYTDVSELDRKSALATCHRFLLYLGDIARYQYSADGHKKPVNLRVAQFYYNEALLLDTNSGDAFAQLALIASFEDDFFSAAQKYSRAALALKPSSSAAGNIQRLYSRLSQTHGDFYTTVAGQSVLLQITWINSQLCIGLDEISSGIAGNLLETTGIKIFDHLREMLSNPTCSENAALFDSSNSLIECSYLFIYSLHITSHSKNDTSGRLHLSAVLMLLHYLACLLDSVLVLLSATSHHSTDISQVMQPVKLLCGWLETSTWCWCKNPDTTQRAPFEIRNHRVWTVFPRVLNHLLHAMDASDVLSTHKPVQSIIFTTAKPGQDECTESCQRLLQCSQLCPLSEDRVVRGFAPFDMSASCLRRGNTVSNSMCSDQLQEKSSSGLAVSVRNTCIVRFGAWLTTHLGGEDGSDHLLYLQRVHPDPRPRQVPNTQPLVALPRSMSSAQPCDNMSSTLSDPQPPARGDPLWAGAILAAHDHHDYSESITLDDTAFGSMEISSPLLSTDDRDVDHAHNAADRMHSTMDHSIVRRIEQEHSGDVTTTALITASASTAWDTNHIQSTEDLFGWDANSGQRATSAAASWETFPKMDPRIGFPKTTTHAHFFGIHQLQSPEGLSATSSTAGSSDAASADGVPMSDTSPTGNTKTSSIITDTLPDTTLPAAGTTASHENITATNPSVPSSRASGIPTTHEWSTGALRSADQHTSVPSVRDPALLTPDQLLPLLK
eukprot:m.635871 g.635871  ORF g.635871 m.635871 type:complete len:892 (-) comp22587_c0_seq20:2462-5137(-)